jgi:hypothetical protein
MNDGQKDIVPDAVSGKMGTWKVSTGALKDEYDFSIPETSASALHR